MSGLGVSQGRTNIGEEALPPFAVLPDPSSLFIGRSKRLRALAPGHTLEAYLNFAADVTEAQHTVQAALPAVPPEPSHVRQSLEDGLPPLSRIAFEPGEATEAVARLVACLLRQSQLPDEAHAAIASLAAAPSERLRLLIDAALKDTPPDNIAGRVLILAGLQVHFSRLAAQLPAADLRPVGNGTCPVCGSPPMTSSVVGWPKAHNTRFCTCSLCATMWHVVRIKCVLCGSTGGIGYRFIEGHPETVKAETCDNCSRYVKILYQVKDHLLDPLGDDIASLDLDMLLGRDGWKRGGHNLFLLGY